MVGVVIFPAVERQGWPSMHHPRQAQVVVEFLVEGAAVAVPDADAKYAEREDRWALEAINVSS